MTLSSAVARFFSALFFLALCGYAATLMRQDWQVRDILGIARRLERGQSVSSAQVTAAAAQIADSDFIHGCRSDILEPSLTVRIFDLDRMNQAQNYDAWTKATAATETFLKTMIACLPNDGNAWLREAMVSRTIAEDAKGLREKMTVARALMPYEGQQVFARIFLWKSISPVALAESEALARSDIVTALTRGGVKLKATLDDHPSPEFAALVKSEVARLRGAQGEGPNVH